nr:tropomodulin-4 isoform X2 [Anser cygnoides]
MLQLLWAMAAPQPPAMTSYRQELEKYRDIDEDKILRELSAEELEQLDTELLEMDPENVLLPAGLRQRDQTRKSPTGPLDREALLQHLEKQALEAGEREDLVPFTGEKKGKPFVPKNPKREIPREEQITLEPELEEALANATEAEMCDIAAILGMYTLMSNKQYYDAICSGTISNTEGINSECAPRGRGARGWGQQGCRGHAAGGLAPGFSREPPSTCARVALRACTRVCARARVPSHVSPRTHACPRRGEARHVQAGARRAPEPHQRGGDAAADPGQRRGAGGRQPQQHQGHSHLHAEGHLRGHENQHPRQEAQPGGNPQQRPRGHREFSPVALRVPTRPWTGKRGSPLPPAHRRHQRGEVAAALPPLATPHVPEGQPALGDTRGDARLPQAVAEMLTENKTLQSLNIESNFITSAGMMSIIKAVYQNNTLSELKVDNQVGTGTRGWPGARARFAQRARFGPLCPCPAVPAAGRHGGDGDGDDAGAVPLRGALRVPLHTAGPPCPRRHRHHPQQRAPSQAEENLNASHHSPADPRAQLAPEPRSGLPRAGSAVNKGYGDTGSGAAFGTGPQG